MSDDADQLARPSGTFAPVQPHGPLTLLFGGGGGGGAAADAAGNDPPPDGLWVVHGSFAMAPMGLLALPRTMVVVRHSGGRICLVHTMRLDGAGEAALTALGPVDAVVRLGSYHGVDDDYYVRTFGATLYVLPGCPLPAGSPSPPVWIEPTRPAAATAADADADTDAAADADAADDADANADTSADTGGSRPPALPIPGAQLFRFHVAKAEGALYLRQFRPPGGGGGGGSGGTLIVCDALVNMPPRPPHVGWLLAAAFRLAGLTGLRPGPLWYRTMKRLSGLDDRAMAAEYQRLLDAYPFAALVCVHGDVVPAGAHERVAAIVAGLVPPV